MRIAGDSSYKLKILYFHIQPWFIHKLLFAAWGVIHVHGASEGGFIPTAPAINNAQLYFENTDTDNNNLSSSLLSYYRQACL